MGLDSEKLGTIRLNIMSIEPLPNMNKVYDALLHEERQRRTESWQLLEATALKATSYNKSR